MVAKAIDLVTPNLRDVAKWIGVSYATARAYRIGHRTPPPATRAKLAAALRAQARKLEQMADRLDAPADPNR